MTSRGEVLVGLLGTELERVTHPHMHLPVLGKPGDDTYIESFNQHPFVRKQGQLFIEGTRETGFNSTSLCITIGRQHSRTIILNISRKPEDGELLAFRASYIRRNRFVHGEGAISMAEAILKIMQQQPNGDGEPSFDLDTF